MTRVKKGYIRGLVLAWFALFVSVLSLTCSVWLFLELSKKLSTEDLKSKLSSSSEELAKNYGRSVKEIETEWDNMYQKFAALAGRMDRRKALEAPAPSKEQPEIQKPMSRNDLIRGRRNV